MRDARELLIARPRTIAASARQSRLLGDLEDAGGDDELESYRIRSAWRPRHRDV
jgi:hypothetical protein